MLRRHSPTPMQSFSEIKSERVMLMRSSELDFSLTSRLVVRQLGRTLCHDAPKAVFSFATTQASDWNQEDEGIGVRKAAFGACTLFRVVHVPA